MSHNPYTHGIFWQALNQIARGDGKPEALTGQFREALLALGSETPDNLNCAGRIEIGEGDGKVGLMLGGHRLADIAHELEDQPIPDALRSAFPNLTDRDWEAFGRVTTLLYIALMRPGGSAE
jgi:hypothetical protein